MGFTGTEHTFREGRDIECKGVKPGVSGKGNLKKSKKRIWKVM